MTYRIVIMLVRTYFLGEKNANRVASVAEQSILNEARFAFDGEVFLPGARTIRIHVSSSGASSEASEETEELASREEPVFNFAPTQEDVFFNDLSVENSLEEATLIPIGDISRSRSDGEERPSVAPALLLYLLWRLLTQAFLK